MLIIIGLDNLEKKIKYIGQAIEYERDLDRGLAISKWRNIFGDEPYINITGKMYQSWSMVKEDREWIKDIFESLVVGSSKWIWK